MGSATIYAKIYYTAADSLNSSTVMTDSTGAITETMDYYPFGEIRIDKSAAPAGEAEAPVFSEQRKYIGQEYDPDTGLNYLNARYYNSNIGRFTTQDPVHLAIGDDGLVKQLTGKSQEEILQDPQQLNAYSYARNNPITMSDPTGRFIDTVLDVGFTGYDLYRMGSAAVRSNWSEVKSESVNLGLDVAGMAIPGVMGMGMIRRAGEAAKLVDKAGDIGKIPEGFSLGQKIDGFGKVIENTSGKINGFFRAEAPNPYHGLDRTIERGVTPRMLLDTVKKPLITFEQINGNIYKLSQQAAVILDKAGNVVTTYSRDQFTSKVANLLDKIAK